jgi:hypothetical protein
MMEGISEMKVDIRTGLPIKREGPTEKEKLEEDRLQAYVSEGLLTEQRLDTDEGKYFVNLIEKLLEKRIDELVSADSQAMTLLETLETLGRKVHDGRSASDRLVKSRLRREGKAQL